MRQRPNITDPQVHETDKRRFQRMRARNRFGKEYLSEIKQCVQKTDYLVNRPTPAKTQRKTVGSPIRKKTKKVGKKIDEDDLYPHVKFVIHPRIQQHKIPKFLNNQNMQQYSKTMAPANDDQDIAKRSLSSSDQPKDRYNLSTLSSTNVSDSNSSNAEMHDEIQNNPDLPKISIKDKAGINSSDSFDDSAHLASLNNEKPQKEVKKQPDYSDYSDSDTTIPKKPGWKFSDSERRGRSSGMTSNDFRWKNSTINKLSSSSDSDAVDIEKIKEELKKEINQEEPEITKRSNQLFFGSESYEPPKENQYSLKRQKNNLLESGSSGDENNINPSSKSEKVTDSKINSIENSYSNNNANSDLVKDFNSLSNQNNYLEEEDLEDNIEIKSSNEDEIKNTNKIENRIKQDPIQIPELDSDFEEYNNIKNKKVINRNKAYAKNDSDYDNDDIQIPHIESQDDGQYSSDYFKRNQSYKKKIKSHQYSSDFNDNDIIFNSNSQYSKNKIYSSQYSSSGDSSRGVRNEKKIQNEQLYKSNESVSEDFKINNDIVDINQNESLNEEEEGMTNEHNSYIDSVSSQKAEKDRISPELEKSLLNTGNNSNRHFVETLSDGYDDDDDENNDNNQFLQNKISKPQKINDSSSSSSAAKEVDIPVSADGEVDNTFNFASSTSESASMMKKKSIDIGVNVDDEEENSDYGFGNEDNVFYNGKNSSSSDDDEVVEATTDTRETEIRENRKLDRRIYSGDQK